MMQNMIPQIGDRVCVKRSVAEPRYAWGGETHHSVGKICDIESDGLLIIEIPNRPIPWQADPSDMEKLEDFKVLTTFFLFVYVYKMRMIVYCLVLFYFCLLVVDR